MRIKQVFFTIGLLVLCGLHANAQISGIKQIPGDYPSLNAAITALNSQGVGIGGVTFNIAAGYIESNAFGLSITASGTVDNPILIQKSGVGANPKLIRTDGGFLGTSNVGGVGDAVIRIEGTDFLTLDGLDLEGANGIDYGIFTHKPSATNGCQNLTIKNASITLDKTNNAYTTGICIGNGTTTTNSATGIAVTSNSGKNKNILITGMSIQNVGSGIFCKGSEAENFGDENITIGNTGSGNTITNLGGTGGFAYPIAVYYASNINVQSNTIDNLSGNTTPHPFTLYGIQCNAVGGIVKIGNNGITLNATTTNAVTWINIAASTMDSLRINNNFFSGNITSTANSYFINNGSICKSYLELSNNYNGTFTKSSASGPFYCYYHSANSTATEKIYNNNFSNITLNGVSTFYGIYSSPSASGSQEVYDNYITNITTGTGALNPIYLAVANKRNVYNNKINTLTGATSVSGIRIVSGGLLECNIFKNKIYDLTSNNTGIMEAGVVGISAEGAALSSLVKVYNNFVGNLYSPQAGGNDVIRGINLNMSVQGVKVEADFNTVYINAVSSHSFYGNSALYYVTANIGDTKLTLRNNILINLSEPKGSAIATAIRRSGHDEGNFNISSKTNNNLLYAGIPSATNTLYFDYVIALSTLQQYKSEMGDVGADQNAVTENPSFISTTGSSPNFLHINPTIPTQIEGGAKPLNTIAFDYDGDTRNATTPDIGADEGSFISLDLKGPSIEFEPLPSIAGLAPRTLKVIIKDPSGVATGVGAPRIYYKEHFSTSYFSALATSISGDSYTFTIDYSNISGVVNGSSIDYYLAAQDQLGNLSTGLSNTGDGIDPPGYVPPSTVSTYFTGGVYTWHGTNNNFDDPNNWLPVRNGFSIADKLIFDGSISPGNINLTASPFGISSLVCRNNANVTLNVSTGASDDSFIYLLGGRPDTSIAVYPGSILTVASTSAKSIAAFYNDNQYIYIGGTLNLNGATTLNVTSTLVEVTGAVGLNGTSDISNSNNTNLIFANGSYLNFGKATTTIPVANYQDNSIINIASTASNINITSWPPRIGGLIWNCPSQTNAYTMSAVYDFKGNVTLQNTGSGRLTFNTSVPINVSGNFTVNGGTLNIGSAGANIDGNFLFNGGTILKASTSSTAWNAAAVLQNSTATFNIGTNAGLFKLNATSGNVTLSGTVNGGTSGGMVFGFTGTGDQLFNPGSATITNRVGLETNKSMGKLILGNNFTLNAGSALLLTQGPLEIPAGKILTINGTADFNDQPVTLKSDVSGTAALARIQGSLTGATNVTAELYNSGRRAFRFFSHPFNHSLGLDALTDNIDITGGTNGSFTSTVTNNPSAFWFNTASGDLSTIGNNPGWTAFTHTNGLGNNAWAATQGIRVLVRGSKGQGLNGGTYTPSPVTLNMTGTINTGNQSVNLKGGFNLVGNPYPSPVEIGNRIAATANITGSTFWIWDATAATTGAYVPAPIGMGYNLAMNGVAIVQANGVSTLTFSEANKAAAATQNAFRNNNTPNGLLELQVLQDGNYWDKLYIRDDRNASAEQDKQDGIKMMNPVLNFYTLSKDNHSLSLDARPLQQEETIPLVFNTSTLTSYTIVVASYGLNTTATWFLHDKLTDTYTLLQQGSAYTFYVTTEPHTQGAERFELVQRKQKATPAFTLKLTPNPATDNVTLHFTADAQSLIQITGADGKMMKSITTGEQVANSIAIPVKGWAKGIYYVTLTNNKERTTQLLQVQ